MFTLRPYQEKAVQAGLDFYRGSKSKGALMILPTGSGKSLVIANIAKNLEGNTIVFQPSKEILEQNYAKIKSYGVDDVSIFSASLGEKNIAKITFATIGSVIKHVDRFSSFQNIIIDECHGVNANNGMYKTFITVNKGKVLGLTATPYRLKSCMNMFTGKGYSELKFLTRSRPRVFDKVVHVTQIPEIAEQGFLATLKYFEVDCIKPEDLVKNTTGADYTDSSLMKHLREISFNDRVMQVVTRLSEIKRKKILIFTKFVADAVTIQKRCDAQFGVGFARMVSGETPKKEREEILAAFKDMNDPCMVVLNVGVLTTGFDFPELDTVILARPTMSLGLYYQMVGRGIRPHPNKEYAMIVDMAGIKKKFGPVENLWVDNLDGKEMRVVRIGQNGKIITNKPLE